jgi:hypothetical protein
MDGFSIRYSVCRPHNWFGNRLCQGTLQWYATNTIWLQHVLPRSSELILYRASAPILKLDRAKHSRKLHPNSYSYVDRANVGTH